MKYIHFFATKDDILPVLAEVESKTSVKYVRMGIFTSSEAEPFNAGAEIPRLGTATCESSMGCETFLVCERELQIQLRPIQVQNVGERFAVDQLFNDDTIVFTAGGIWTEEVLLNGCVATVSDLPPAQALMRRFQSAFKKTFVKIRAFHVGPNAVVLLDAGKRLAGAGQSPRELDLSRP